MSKKNRRLSTPFRNPQSIQRATASIEAFSGPLPPASMLEQYNQVLPGAAERILAMAERQSAHRQDLEKTVVAGHVKSERLGAILGFILSLVVVCGGFSLIYNGMIKSGSAIVISDLAALAGAYAYGRKMQKQERSEKLKMSS